MGNDFEQTIVTVTEVAVRIATCEMASQTLTAYAFASGTPGYAVARPEARNAHPGLISLATPWLVNWVRRNFGTAKTMTTIILAGWRNMPMGLGCPSINANDGFRPL
jgi:hypothetical protein